MSDTKMSKNAGAQGRPALAGYTAADVERAAAAIANARGGRRGMPPIKNVLDILPDKLRREVMEDAEAALEAAAAV